MTPADVGPWKLPISKLSHMVLSDPDSYWLLGPTSCAHQTVMTTCIRTLTFPDTGPWWLLILITAGVIQMKHQLDATLCRFYFCRVTTCFGRKRPSSRVFRTSTAATGTCVIVAGKSSRLLIRAGVLVLNTPVEWPCRIKTCTVLHQVGVSFDLH
jgi:hypothetical protein